MDAAFRSRVICHVTTPHGRNPLDVTTCEIHHQMSGHNDAVQACVYDRSGKFLLVTRYWESGVSVLPWNPADGTIGEVCCAPQHSGSGPHPLRQSMLCVALPVLCTCTTTLGSSRGRV